jgi:hypothetical protein
MSRALKSFVFFAGVAFLIGAVGYLVARAVMPGGRVFAGLPRMFMYHEEHPFQYIAVVAVTYGVIASVYCVRAPHLVGWKQGLGIVGVIALTIIVASVPGGVLWKIHDMQAGFFTKGARFWRDLLWGAGAGLNAGWLVIALSFPFNVIGLVIGFGMTFWGVKRMGRSRHVEKKGGKR